MSADQSNPALRALADGSIPSFTLKWDKAEDGTYYVELRLVGLLTEKMAHAGMRVIEDKFSGGELNAS